MLLQIKKSKLKQIVYICIIILVFNFTLVMAQEEVLQTSENVINNEAPESEVSSQAEEPDSMEIISEEEEIIPEQIEQSLEKVDETVLAEDGDEKKFDGLSMDGEIDIEDIPETATGTDEIPQDLGGEPIIFVFDSAEEEDESGSSTSLIVQADDESLYGTSTASSTDSAALFEIENSSSTESVSSSTEESFVSGGSLQTTVIGSVSSVVFDQPKIIAQWQMLASGDDDSADFGVQILPSGEYKIDKKYTACAIIGGDLGASGSVLANVNYPEGIAHGNSFERGCGQQKNEIELNKTAKEEAIELVCGKIRNNNNNLLFWHKDEKTGYAYDYEKVCGLEGFLARESVSLFCAESALAFDDPAGKYEIVVMVKDNQENLDEARNVLKYLELTTFENDFSNFQYGKVNQNELKILKGDSVWGNSFYPTVRNTGNTRLQIKIRQNDFNLGKTNGVWNLEYRTRVGENAEWLSYFPYKYAYLKDPLDLGKITNIDFAILVKKYPENDNRPAFSGEMILSAEKAPALVCQK